VAASQARTLGLYPRWQAEGTQSKLQFLKFLTMMFLIHAFVNIPAYIFFASGNSSALETSKDLKA
jgi:hypothetical protein